MNKSKRLFIIYGYDLGEVILKGEVTPRYFNPENYFDEVYLGLIYGEHLNLPQAQIMVGTAKLYIMWLDTPRHFMVKTLGFRPRLYAKQMKHNIKRIVDIKPDAIRIYGDKLHGFLGYLVKKTAKIPYVISLHSYNDFLASSWQERLGDFLGRTVRELALRNADSVIAVYSSIFEKYKKYNKNTSLVYNVVGIVSDD